MALIKCPECYGKISDKAAVCIHCGMPLTPSEVGRTQTKNMQKPMGAAKTTVSVTAGILLAILILILLPAVFFGVIMTASTVTQEKQKDHPVKAEYIESQNRAILNFQMGNDATRKCYIAKRAYEESLKARQTNDAKAWKRKLNKNNCK